MRNSMISGLIVLSLTAIPAFAQQVPTGMQVTSSQPGKASSASKVKASAVVTAIDNATRTLTLKGPKGRTFDVVAGDEVRNFEQIQVGDEVVVQYVRALSLELRKGGAPRERVDSADSVRAEPGEKPGGAIGRKVTALCDVIDVNPKGKTITLKGPKGNIVELDVKDPDQFKVVKKGDQVEVEYVEALAVAVKPAKK